ncbi:MAG: lysylphosphatidylglycerol synthase transmembrane domain-containing protein [Candidatus Latescibacterota bacterium]
MIHLWKVRWIILGLLLAGIILIIVRIDVEKAWRYATEADRRWIFLAALINIAATWFEAVRWKIILYCIKQNIKLRRVFGATLVGIFGNTLMPLRLGDGARAYYLSRKEGISFASTLSTVMLDFFLNTAFFVLFAIIIFLVYPFPFRHPVLIAILVLVTGILFLSQAIFPRHHLVRKARERFGKKISVTVSRFLEGFSALRDAGILFHASTISMLLWAMKIFMVWCMVRAYSLDIGMIGASVVMALTNLGIAAVSTPANLGGYELSTIAGLRLFGVDIERAVSFAVVFHLVEVLPVMLLGFLVLTFSGMKSRELFGNKKTGDRRQKAEEKNI